MSATDPADLRPETRAVAVGRPHEPGSPMNAPLVPASNFRHGPGPVGGPEASRSYAREDATATWEAFEEVVGALEGGRATAFSSGMAAAAAILDVLPGGGRVLLPRDCYQGVRHLLHDGEAVGRWEVVATDITDHDDVRAKLDGAALLWIETPSNPLIEVADLPALTALARDAGVRTAVDATFATPLLLRPLELGADVVMHSVTKFLGGHSDLLMGVAITTDPELHAALRRRRLLAGALPGTLESFLATRGVRTLAVRLHAAQANAAELARRLDAHPAVARVRYPGLAGDPGHGLASQQMDGFGAMVSFELADGEAADHACRAVRLITHATSLGGVETTMERRAVYAGQEHVPDGLIRMSVGCEHVEDLWADLEQAITSS